MPRSSKSTITKPSAADRTVDMFTGSTKVEAVEQSDVVEEAKEADPSIESNMDRYRETAFYYQEFLSKNFVENPHNRETFRLTIKNGDMFLEKKAANSGEAYHWAGFMFRYSSLEELTTCFVAALREKRSREQKAG